MRKMRLETSCVVFNKEEELSLSVREETAAFVNAGLCFIVSLDREKELTDKITRPANLMDLWSPR